MKNPFKPNLFKNIRSGLLVAASVSNSQAQPYYVVGNYNGWTNASTNAMTDNRLVNGNEQYSYRITGQTPDSYPGGGRGNNGLKVTDGTWNNTWPGNSMELMYDGLGNATVYFYPGTITRPMVGRPWQTGSATLTPAQHGTRGRLHQPAVGNTVANGNNGTGSDPLAHMTLKAGSAGVYTNIYIVATPGTYNFKFRTPGTWNSERLAVILA